MKKSEVQAIYREVKRGKRRANGKAGQTRTGGCSSCGKVTWKPYNR